MIKTTIRLVGTTIALSALSLGASATADSWKIWQGQDQEAPRLIYSEGSAPGNTLIGCGSDGRMIAAFSEAEGDMPAIMGKNAPYKRGERVTIAIDGDEVANEKLKYSPANGVLQPKGHKIATKLFNATVKGETVTAQRKGAEALTLNLPKVDGVFAALSKTCGALRE